MHELLRKHAQFVLGFIQKVAKHIQMQHKHTNELTHSRSF